MFSDSMRRWFSFRANFASRIVTLEVVLEEPSVPTQYHAELYAVDTSNVPTGSPLASQSFPQRPAGDGSCRTVTFGLAGGAVGSYLLAPGSSYAIVLQTVGDGSYSKWCYPVELTPVSSTGWSYLNYGLLNGDSW